MDEYKKKKTLVKVLGKPITAHEMIKIQKNRPPPPSRKGLQEERIKWSACHLEGTDTHKNEKVGGEDSATLYLKPKQDMGIQQHGSGITTGYDIQQVLVTKEYPKIKERAESANELRY